MSGPGTPLLSSLLHHAAASNPNILPISIPPQTPIQNTAPIQNSNASGSKGGAGAGGGGGSGGGGAGGKKRKASGDADDDGGKKRIKTPRACDSCRRKKIRFVSSSTNTKEVRGASHCAIMERALFDTGLESFKRA
ncbi:hypothetical protein BT69DRAFT_55159 [Atractiella rhizophila]|nr:hypothetical protein BT69DRAFT_55159 [Atractiella rhizophila]